MPLPSLPTEIQLLILTDIVDVSSAAFTWTLEGEDTWGTIFLAVGFVAARTAASVPPTTRSTTPLLVGLRLENIRDPLVLRVALAAALPAWRATLRGIPALWSRIAVPVNKQAWGAVVLDAVQEAIDCSKEEPLSVAITYTPDRSGNGCIRGECDGGESERAQIAQLMALLMPHISRLSSLRVCPWHGTALPLPGIDFGGNALILKKLHLCAAIPVATHPATLMGECPLLAPCLDMLAVDAHIFHAAYLHKPSTVPPVHILVLRGPGINNEESFANGSPRISMRALLTCLAQIPLLKTVGLDGVDLCMGYEEDNDLDKTGQNTMLEGLRNLVCHHLSASVLGELLKMGFSGDLDDGEEDGEEVSRQLKIVECMLPDRPPLHAFKRVDLEDIPVTEDIASFLWHASECTTLAALHCEGFPLQMCNWFRGTRLGWFLPQLRVLSLEDCPKANTDLVQEVMRVRSEAAEEGEAVTGLLDVLLDDQTFQGDPPDAVDF